MYHAFAIYELRTAAGGGVEGPWHVFVSDVFNMRQLLPQQDSWLPNVASLLLSVGLGREAPPTLKPRAHETMGAFQLLAIGDTWLVVLPFVVLSG